MCLYVETHSMSVHACRRTNLKSWNLRFITLEEWGDFTKNWEKQKNIKKQPRNVQSKPSFFEFAAFISNGGHDFCPTLTHSRSMFLL